MPLNQVENIILVLSGKGGVGKSSVTTQLALSLSLQGYNVGVLDLDLTGPNAPRFFGIEDKRVTMVEGGLGAITVHEAMQNPAENYGNGNNASSSGDLNQPGNRKDPQKLGELSVISLGFILSTRSTAVIWRGPKKTAMVRQFLTQTVWPSLVDYLLIDTPPGTSDEHISLLETLLSETSQPNSSNLAGAVVVTTPQAVATSDVRKELSFCTKTKTPILGVIENMAGFVCPHCAECTNIFSHGGGEIMAREYGVPFLGRVPIDPMFGRLIEEGHMPEYPIGTIVGERDVSTMNKADAIDETTIPLVVKYQQCSLWPVFDKIVDTLVRDIKRKTET